MLSRVWMEKCDIRFRNHSFYIIISNSAFRVFFLIVEVGNGHTPLEGRLYNRHIIHFCPKLYLAKLIKPYQFSYYTKGIVILHAFLEKIPVDNFVTLGQTVKFT